MTGSKNIYLKESYPRGEIRGDYIDYIEYREQIATTIDTVRSYSLKDVTLSPPPPSPPIACFPSHLPIGRTATEEISEEC